METDQQKSSNSGNPQADRNTSAMDIQKLRQIVMKQYKRNIDLYHRLKDDDVFIDFALCIPPSQSGRLVKANCLESERKELMTLMDKLMLESDRLEKLDRKNTFNEQLRPQLEDPRTAVDIAFGFMRKAWTQEVSTQECSDDKIDRLSKVVGSIKGNLQRVLVSHRRNDKNIKPIQQSLLDIPAFAQLKEAYERLKMKLEDRNFSGQSEIKQLTERLRQKEKQAEQLRIENKEQRQRIKKLENMSIAAEAKIQQLTERLNKFTFEQDKSEKRVKVVYTGQDFELSVRPTKLTDIEKTFLACDKTLEEIRLLLQTRSNDPTALHEHSMQQVDSNTEPRGSLMKAVSDKKSTSIRKMQSPSYRDQISNVKFSRTNVTSNGLPPRKPSEQAGLQAKFYTKLDIIEKLQGAFMK